MADDGAEDSADQRIACGHSGVAGTVSHVADAGADRSADQGSNENSHNSASSDWYGMMKNV